MFNRTIPTKFFAPRRQARKDLFTAETQSTQRVEFLPNRETAELLCALCGREKKFKNLQNRKICLNEIKYLQLLILAKRDFFSRPVSLR